MPEPANLRAAITLLSEGFWAHAVHARGERKPDGTFKSGKRPIGRAWGLARWDERRLRDAFNYEPAAGVGVALGPDRGPGGRWVVDLEGDGPGSAESLARLLGGELLGTRGWGSTRGAHSLFFVDGARLLAALMAAGASERSGQQAGVWHLDGLPGLEFRIGGFKDDGTTAKQVQSVCPPTIGDDGKPRQWNGVDAIASLPESAYSRLQAMGETSRPTTHTPASDRNGASATSAYGRAALENEINEFSRRTEGGRHAYLLAATMKLASLVKAGALTERECLAGLQEGARSNGMGAGRFSEIAEAWRSAMQMVDARMIPAPGRSGMHSLPEPQPSRGVTDVNETEDDPHRLARLHWHARPNDRYFRGEWSKWQFGSYRALTDPELESEMTRAVKSEFDRLNHIAIHQWEKALADD